MVKRNSLLAFVFAAGLILSSAMNAHAVTIKVACVGNSITQGIGADAGKSYPDVLQQLLGSGYAVKNEGVSGTTLQKSGDYPYWITPQFLDVFTYKPAIITIKLGTNDAKAVNWKSGANTYIADLKAMIDTFQTISPRPQIYLVLPAPAFNVAFGIDGDTIRYTIIPIIKSIASQRSLPTIDCNAPLKYYPALFPDGVHPSNEGADSIAHIIYRALPNYHAATPDSLTFTMAEGGLAPVAQTVVVTDAGNVAATGITATSNQTWLIPLVSGGTITNTVAKGSLPSGIYTARVTVSKGGTVVCYYGVSFTITGSPRVTSIRISPRSAAISANDTIRYSAALKDQFGAAIAGTVSFSVSGGGTISTTGLFTKNSINGSFKVIAMIGSVSDTVLVTSIPTGYSALSGYVRRMLLLVNPTTHSPNIAAGGDPAAGLLDVTTFLPTETATALSYTPKRDSTVLIGSVNYTWIDTSIAADSSHWFGGDQAAENFVGYGALTVYSADTQTCQLELIADNFLKIWDNGVVIATARDVYGPPYTAPKLVICKLNNGVNSLVFRFQEGGGGNWASLRILDAAGTGLLSGLSYSVNGDAVTTAAVVPPVQIRGSQAIAPFTMSMINNAYRFSFAAGSQFNSIKVCDLSGRTLLSQSVNSTNSVDVKLPAGRVYIIQAVGNGLRVVERIVSVQ